MFRYGNCIFDCLIFNRIFDKINLGRWKVYICWGTKIFGRQTPTNLSRYVILVKTLNLPAKFKGPEGTPLLNGAGVTRLGWRWHHFIF